MPDKPTPVREREPEYFPQPDGEFYMNSEGNLVIGWENRSEDQDEEVLRAGFEAFAHGLDLLGEGKTLLLTPILARWATEVECKIYGWEEGTFVRCTKRAKHPFPLWQIEVTYA